MNRISITAFFLVFVSSVSATILTAENLGDTEIAFLARSAYFSRMKEARAPLLPRERITRMETIELLFDVPGFAKAGSTIVEVRIGLAKDDVRAILWCNPDTKEVKAVIGPWIAAQQ